MESYSNSSVLMEGVGDQQYVHAITVVCHLLLGALKKHTLQELCMRVCACTYLMQVQLLISLPSLLRRRASGHLRVAEGYG